MNRRSMKKIFSIALLVFLLALLAACGNNSSNTSSNDSSNDGNKEKDSASTEALVFTMGHMNSTDHVQHLAMEHFAEEVEKATDGRVKFEIYPGGALGSPAETLDNIKTGIMDAGWGLQGYNAGQFPVHSVLHLPFLADGTGEDLSVVAQELYNEFPEVQEEYADVVPLWFHAADPYAIITKGKQVKSFEDVKGLKLRTPSVEAGKMIESWGATPVSIPAPEIYDSMQKGVIDGGVLPVAAIFDFNLTDIVDYVAIGNFNTSLFYVVMNEDSWNQISSDDQEKIKELGGIPMSEWSGHAFDEQAEEAEKGAKEAGAEFTILSDEEIEKFKEASKGVAEEWISKMEKDGVNGQEIYDKTVELIESKK